MGGQPNHSLAGGGLLVVIRPEHVAAYIRWSTDDQAQGTTLELQRERCIAYVQSQGWQWREDLCFVDDGVSGGSLDRPSLSRLRSLVVRREVDCVVVMKIDRLSRNIVDAVNLVLREWKDRCHIKSVLEPIDTTTDMGRMIFNILAMFADFERATIRERTYSGKVKKIAEGQQMNGRPAYGYKAHPTEKGRWLENPDESALVRRIFQLAEAGRSAHQIARQLNDDGLRPRRAKEWSVNTVLWILHNATYIGEVEFGRTKTIEFDDADLEPDPWTGKRRRPKRVQRPRETPVVHVRTNAAPALVDPQTFNRVQDRLAANRTERRAVGSRALSSPYLLVGLARCPCGSPMVHSGPYNRRPNFLGYYVCQRIRSGGCHASGYVPVPQADAIVEAEFLRLYGLQHIRHERFVRLVGQADQEQASLSAAIHQEQVQLEQLAAEDEKVLRAARAAQEIDLKHLEALRGTVMRDREAVEARLATLKDRLAVVDLRSRALQSTLESLDAIGKWQSLPVWQRRQLLRLVLKDRVILARPKGSREVTVEIPWLAD